MNDPTIISAAIVTVLAAVTAAVVTIINAAAAARDRQVMHTKVDLAATKADEIHTLVNGSAHAAAAKLADLEAQIKTLHERLTTLQDQRIAEAQQSTTTKEKA